MTGKSTWKVTGMESFYYYSNKLEAEKIKLIFKEINIIKCNVLQGYSKLRKVIQKAIYFFLMGINQDFGHIHRYLAYENIKKGDLKKQEKFLQSLCFLIGKYGEAVKSGFFKDLSEEELPLDVFDNIDDIEKTIDEFLERYVETVVEYDEEFDCNNCFLKINKKNMKKKLTRIIQG